MIHALLLCGFAELAAATGADSTDSDGESNDSDDEDGGARIEAVWHAKPTADEFRMSAGPHASNNDTSGCCIA